MFTIDTVGNLRPGLSVIRGAIKIRFEVIRFVACCRDVQTTGFGWMGLDRVNLAPLWHFRWRHVFPVFTRVARDVNQPVVAAAPNRFIVLNRFASCKDRAVVLDAGVVLGDRSTRRTKFRFIIPSQIATDLFPRLTFISRLEQNVGCSEQRFRIMPREEDWKVPLKTKLAITGSVAIGLSGQT